MKSVQIQDQGKIDVKLRDGVYLGTLLSPAEVAQATAERSERLPCEVQRWTLCGDVDPSVFSMLHASGQPQRSNERLTVVVSESGMRYAVFTHQVGVFQHRYVAALFDQKMVRCVRAVAHGDALGFSLGGEGTHALIWPTAFGVMEFLPLLPLCCETPPGQEKRMLRDFADTVLELRDPRRIPSALDGVTVGFASVSAIAPEALIDKVAAHHGH